MGKGKRYQGKLEDLLQGLALNHRFCAPAHNTNVDITRCRVRLIKVHKFVGNSLQHVGVILTIRPDSKLHGAMKI